MDNQCSASSSLSTFLQMRTNCRLRFLRKHTNKFQVTVDTLSSIRTRVFNISPLSQREANFLSPLEHSSLAPSVTLLEMGIGPSSFHGERCGASIVPSKPTLGDLPEGCVALILKYMDPPQICKLAILNRTFHDASLADFVWESKFPSNFDVLVKKIFGDLPTNLGKRGIYAKLCQLNTLDDGTKKVWLDKHTGKLCLAMSSKGLSITGIDDRRYWNHIQTEESRFNTVAYLQQIWWFEVDGEVDFPFPEGKYSIYFRIHLGRPSKRFGRRVCNKENVHGWDIKPVRLQLWSSDGQYAASQCFLDGPSKWSYYHAGDFVVGNGHIPTKIKFSLTQIDCTHTKGGLCLDSVLIYPTDSRKLKSILNSNSS